LIASLRELPVKTLQEPAGYTESSANKWSLCDPEMALEEKRNENTAETALRGAHDHRLPRRSLALPKWQLLHVPLHPRAKGKPGYCDYLVADDAEPPAGAHLITRRIGYVHHGIYLGAGKVIHSGAFPGLLPRGPVEEVSLECFSRGRYVWVRAGVPARFTPQEVIDRARSRLGENRYDLLRNNCEHLCEWCLQGTERSHQVERLLRWLRPWQCLRGRNRRSALVSSLGCGAV